MTEAVESRRIAASAPLRVHALIDSLNWGGAESLLADLATGAPAAGIDLTVGYLQEFNGSPNADRLRTRGIEPRHVGIKRLVDPSALLRTRRQLQDVAPDIVHTHLGDADVHGTLAARSLGIPAVSTLHLVAARRTGDRRHDTKERLMALTRRHAGRRVITVSEAARTAYLGTGWDRPEHVVTVHNGIALTAPLKSSAEMRAELGLSADDLVVSMITVLRPGKGHDVAVDALRRLLPRFPRLRLVVAGDGPSRAEIEKLVAPFGDAVVLAGHRSDVMELLGATDILLHPTSMDAFPTTLLEAGAAAVPVLATAVGGIPEIVTDEETGLLVPAPPSAELVANQLERLLDDAGLRNRLGTNARARFDAEFTAESWALRLRAVYDAVLAER
ncbi:MAG TPA: glycosyltransferase family 4 protein [Baekduia sp.]|nr:glycosyltransferase family 4 protein [Baekduia sp.]